MDLAERVLAGDKRGVARLISLIEAEDEDAFVQLGKLHSRTGKAHIIGVTGPPGSGKSTIVDRMAKAFRQMDKKVGIIAVDPTSPFTGGAILGDRIRMLDLTLDEGVFIRSMGTRGHLGGLSRAASGAVKVLDAFGMDIILIETVGAGQSEVEIVSHAHTTIIVEMPGLGDEIQTIKAGIMEIGDIFVINKADRQGADKTAMEIQAMLGLNPEKPEWEPPILQTIARTNKGIDALVEKAMEHYDYLKKSGNFENILEQGIREELEVLIKNQLGRLMGQVVDRERQDEFINKIMEKELDPYTAANILMENVKGKLCDGD
ncbi:MAG: methylmalonyl Co-A mutase-associated GTPase MeaB [Thermoplasmata archaeon]|nr:methylmalonyl Co-A mutase-associated GTPase MeaB [Thermoplasmata archaeon]